MSEGAHLCEVSNFIQKVGFLFQGAHVVTVYVALLTGTPVLDALCC